ncbi:MULTISPECIES: ABC transporter substrate-binding protein [Desulfosediminicola]|uniref:ABC transporter substrate-binding protein n=1 Tax=Desulfosediminicola TaxID=2886823 RepID=UPI0010AC4596|nr:ABC transporter substrate-binding protein [Desulfosediminicola ganghwensis]
MKKLLALAMFAICLTTGFLVPATPVAAKTVKVGVQPWLGYGPWWIADQKGFFAKHGLDAEIVNFTWDADMSAAVASGRVQVIAAATNTLITVRNQGIDLQAFLILDSAYEADAILAPKSVQTIADLKGKKVAYEAGATSDLLINYALKENGMTIRDIEPVNMAAADAGLALIAGRVDIAVTYEPYISAALRQGDDYKVLYTGAEKPGLISDVAISDATFIKDNPETIQALIKAWDEAVRFLNENPEEGGKIIADAVKSPMDEYKLAMEGVHVYDLKGNQEILAGEFQKTMVDINTIMKETTPDVIKTVADPADALGIDVIKNMAK